MNPPVFKGNPLVADLDHFRDQTPGLWERLRGQRIFITGGTGFFGSWLLESFARANQQFQLGAEAVVLTRNPSAFAKRAAALAANPAIKLWRGDFQSFEFPKGNFSHILHAATETNPMSTALDPVELFDANLQGTRRVLEFARVCGARRLLFTSSGAVYGRQPSEVSYVSESYLGAPVTTHEQTAYGHSKRASEFLWAAHGHKHGVAAVIARCFAFVGPHLPLDANYAIGNFIGDALNGRPIRVNGDGTPYRSYLYAADLAVWLWTILLRGQGGQAYNVGSDADLTIAQLAHLVAEVVNPRVEVIITQQPDPAKPPLRYVPSIDRARSELGLAPRIDLREAIRRTAEWNRPLNQ